MHLRMIAILSVVVTLLLGRQAFCYGPMGHLIIYELALRMLPEEAVKSLLQCLPEELRDRPSEVANWADNVSNEEEYRYTKPLHFVEAKDVESRTTPNLLTALDTYTRRIVENAHNKNVFQESTLSEQDGIDLPRLSLSKMLLMVIHLVGDIHQPLHVAARDVGGTGIRVRFGNLKINLHKVWDSAMVDKRIRIHRGVDGYISKMEDEFRRKAAMGSKRRG